MLEKFKDPSLTLDNREDTPKSAHTHQFGDPRTLEPALQQSAQEKRARRRRCRIASPSWGMTSVNAPEVCSKHSDATLERCGRTMCEISDSGPVGTLLTFVQGAHSGTRKALLESAPQAAPFFEGARVPEFGLGARL